MKHGGGGGSVMIWAWLAASRAEHHCHHCMCKSEFWEHICSRTRLVRKLLLQKQVIPVSEGKVLYFCYSNIEEYMIYSVVHSVLHLVLKQST